MTNIIFYGNMTNSKVCINVFIYIMYVPVLLQIFIFKGVTMHKLTDFQRGQIVCTGWLDPQSVKLMNCIIF